MMLFDQLREEAHRNALHLPDAQQTHNLPVSIALHQQHDPQTVSILKSPQLDLTTTPAVPEQKIGDRNMIVQGTQNLSSKMTVSNDTTSLSIDQSNSWQGGVRVLHASTVGPVNSLYNDLLAVGSHADALEHPFAIKPCSDDLYLDCNSPRQALVNEMASLSSVLNLTSEYISIDKATGDEICINCQYLSASLQQFHPYDDVPLSIALARELVGFGTYDMCSDFTLYRSCSTNTYGNLKEIDSQAAARDGSGAGDLPLGGRCIADSYMN